MYGYTLEQRKENQFYSSVLNSTTLGKTENRVQHTESKMEDFALSHNVIVDAYNDLADKHESLKAKRTDPISTTLNLEGYQKATRAELSKYILDLIKMLIPEANKQDLIYTSQMLDVH